MSSTMLSSYNFPSFVKSLRRQRLTPLRCSGVAEVETASGTGKLMVNKFHNDLTKSIQSSEMFSVVVAVVRRQLKPSINCFVDGKENEPVAGAH